MQVLFTGSEVFMNFKINVQNTGTKNGFQKRGTRWKPFSILGTQCFQEELVSLDCSRGQSFLNSFLVSNKPPQIHLHVVQNTQLVGTVLAASFFSDLCFEDWLEFFQSR